MGRSSQLRCTTNLCPRPFPATTSDSTSRMSPLRTSREDTSPLTPRTSPPAELRTSPPRTNLQRILSSLGLPHCSYCLQIQRDQGEGRSSYRKGYRNQPQIHQVW